ncbi:unnamed protein product [Blepharisma stoltei]|uniref:Uncharacterized protein n=1 Tax=Blepharisma stoltei TaxID=1481888 RepID=A0AAU9KBV3_9CILI|nr:unnamed protein product [Blepharisma stoltei]
MPEKIRKRIARSRTPNSLKIKKSPKKSPRPTTPGYESQRDGSRARRIYQVSPIKQQNSEILHIKRSKSRPSSGVLKFPKKHLETEENDLFNSIRNDLEAEWNFKNIPESLRSLYRECVFGLPTHKSITLMSRELNDLISNKATVQFAIKSVEEREKNIWHIKDLIYEFNKSSEEERMGALMNFSEILQNYRVLSLSAIESIIIWRDQLAYAQIVSNLNIRNVRRIPFIWNGENYIVRMKSDMDFLGKTELAKYFYFSDQSDPFLICPSDVKWDMSEKINELSSYFAKKTTKMLIPLPEILMNRVKLAEIIINEELIKENEVISHYVFRRWNTRSMANPEYFKIKMEDETNSKISEELTAELIQNFIGEILPQMITAESKMQQDALCFDEISINLLESICNEFSLKIAKKSYEKQIYPVISEQIFNDLLMKFDYKLAKISKNLIKEEIKDKKRNEAKRIKKMKTLDNDLAVKIANQIFWDCVKKSFNLAKLAENILLGELKKAEEKNDKINKEIAEIITKELISQFIEDQRIDKFAKEIKNEMISTENQIIDIISNDISERLIMEYLSNYCRNHLMNIFKVLLIKIHTNEFLENITSEMILSIAKNSLNEEARIFNENKMITEFIYEEIISNLANPHKLSLICVEILSVEKFYYMTSKMIFESFILEIISDEWLQEFADSEIENFAQLEAPKSPTYNTPSTDETVSQSYLSFANEEAFEYLANVEFKPVETPENLIQTAMNEYYKYLPSIIKENIPSAAALVEKSKAGINTSWYWIKKRKKIIGLLVFSIEPNSLFSKKVIILHISCIHFSSFNLILEHALNLIWNREDCDEIRLYFVNERPRQIKDMPKELKSLFFDFKFRWKTEIDEEIGTESYLGILRQSDRPKNSDERPQENAIINSVCSLSFEDDPIPYNSRKCREVLIFGNRICLIHALLSLFFRTQNPKKLSLIQIPLQNELSNLLGYMNTVEYEFKYLRNIVSKKPEDVLDYIKDQGYDSVLPENGLNSLSLLNLSFNWTSYNHFSHKVGSEYFDYFQFKNNLKIISTESAKIFIIPTSLPDIFTFIIKSENLAAQVKQGYWPDDLDLFTKVEDIFKEINALPSELAELWLPSFKKYCKWEIPWVEGYKITHQGMSEEKYVKRCHEQISVEISSAEFSDGILKSEIKEEFILFSDFVFGLVLTNLDSEEINPIPLFVTYVQEDDLIHSVNSQES